MKMKLLLCLGVIVSALNTIDAEVYNLGCWGTSSTNLLSRSLERTDPILDGSYQNRRDAIAKCKIAANNAGYVIFALQNGGECRSGFASMNSYKSDGESDLCAGDGKGGFNSIQVYRIDYPATVSVSSLGCWGTLNKKVPISSLETDGFAYEETPDVVQVCARAAAAHGFDVFGIKGNGCFSSDDARSLYQKYGRSRNCSQDGNGGVTGFQAYEVNAAIKRKLLGCWRDAPYTIPGLHSTQNVSGYFSYRCVKNLTRVVFSCIGEKKQIHDDVMGLENQICVGDSNSKKLFHRAITNNCLLTSLDDIVHGVYANEISLKNIPLTDLGCWKHISNKMIPSLEGSADDLKDNFTTRTNAVEKCAKVAISRGYDVIALTDGGKCFSGNTFRDSYKMNRLSDACGASGKGATNAMQVYELNIMYMAKFNNLGCWRDTGRRAISNLKGKSGFTDGHYSRRINAFQKCLRATCEKGYNVFALQHSGWCASSANALNTYRKYGRSTSCKSDGEGGPWGNEVYEVESVKKVWLTDLGCWKDNAATLIPALEVKPGVAVGHYLSEVETSTNSKIQKCARAAFAREYSFFALQGGVCRASSNAGQVYKVLGSSDKCLPTGYGGPSANQVYQINVVDNTRFF